MGMHTYIHTCLYLFLFCSKELWPVMDRWIKYRKGHRNIASTPDTIVASVLRLIGELSPVLNLFLLLMPSWWESKCGVMINVDGNFTMTDLTAIRVGTFALN